MAIVKIKCFIVEYGGVLGMVFGADRQIWGC